MEVKKTLPLTGDVSSISVEVTPFSTSSTTVSFPNVEQIEITGGSIIQDNKHYTLLENGALLSLI
jgi:hypothetical protein